jgi:hypothetical protein
MLVTDRDVHGVGETEGTHGGGSGDGSAVSEVPVLIVPPARDPTGRAERARMRVTRSDGHDIREHGDLDRGGMLGVGPVAELSRGIDPEAPRGSVVLDDAGVIATRRD